MYSSYEPNRDKRNKALDSTSQIFTAHSVFELPFVHITLVATHIIIQAVPSLSKASIRTKYSTRAGIYCILFLSNRKNTVPKLADIPSAFYLCTCFDQVLVGSYKRSPPLSTSSVTRNSTWPQRSFNSPNYTSVSRIEPCWRCSGRWYMARLGIRGRLLWATSLYMKKNLCAHFDGSSPWGGAEPARFGAERQEGGCGEGGTFESWWWVQIFQGSPR